MGYFVIFKFLNNLKQPLTDYLDFIDGITCRLDFLNYEE